MSRNLSAGSNLAEKYAIGEIAEFLGVPNYYDATSSKWVKSGTWIPAASLSNAVKATLKSNAYENVAITNNALFAGSSHVHMNTLAPLAKTAAVVAIPWCANDAYAKSLTINASGMQSVSLGQVCGYSGATYGGGHLITSDGTKLWSWTAASATAFGAYSSTDGITWASETLSGQATLAALTSYGIGPSGTQTYATATGEAFTSASTYQLIALWCGARHLLIGLNGSNQYLAQRSSNGTTWGGDESATILGSATLAAGAQAWWYRNGNTAYITTGTFQRKTTDGGATWAAATNALAASTTVLHRINSSDATRLASSNTGSTAMAFSADSGATWTARTLPIAAGSATCSLFGRSTTWVLCQQSTGLMYKTTDDGANWTVLTAPAGLTGIVNGVYADANRWYMLSIGSDQIATSTDLSTWTVRNIGNSGYGTSYTYAPGSLVATDTNTIMGIGATGITLHSTDGGVTWYWSKVSSDTSITSADAKYCVANTIGSAAFVSGLLGASNATTAAAMLASEITAGGAYYRTSSGAITPLRAGALVYSRVA